MRESGAKGLRERGERVECVGRERKKGVRERDWGEREIVGQESGLKEKERVGRERKG